VRVRGAGVCHTDLHIIEGIWREKVSPSLPLTLEHKNAGLVEEVGEAVSRFKKGGPVILHPRITDVVCRACRAGEDMHCENLRFTVLTMDGGFAEFMVTSVRCLVKIDGLELAEITPLADAGLTAMRAVRKAALNPARAFGPALASGNFSSHRAYWLGPIVGAFAAFDLGAYLSRTSAS